jgi:hypothetical protein
MKSRFGDLARIIFWYLSACGGCVTKGSTLAAVPGFRSAVICGVPFGPQLIVTPTTFDPVFTATLSTFTTFVTTSAAALSLSTLASFRGTVLKSSFVTRSVRFGEWTDKFFKKVKGFQNGEVLRIRFSLFEFSVEI